MSPMSSATSDQQPINIQPARLTKSTILIVILVAILLHLLAIMAMLSVKPAQPPKVNVLEAQILSQADAQRIRSVSNAVAQKTSHHNEGDTAEFQPTFISSAPSQSTWQPTQDVQQPSHPSVYEYEHIEHPSIDETIMTYDTQGSASIDAPAAQDNTTPKTTPSADLKQAASAATARIIMAWEKYNDAGGKKLKITIQLDDAGNVTGVRIGSGDQEIASSATAAIYDSSPISEMAGLQNSLTIEFNSTQ